MSDARLGHVCHHGDGCVCVCVCVCVRGGWVRVTKNVLPEGEVVLFGGLVAVGVQLFSAVEFIFRCAGRGGGWGGGV